MKKLLLALLMVLGIADGAGAQLTVPNSFVPFQRLTAAQVNANFTALGAALNRTGGTLTGNMTVSAGVTIDGADISTYLAGGKLAALSTAADSIKVSGGITAAGVAVVDITGKIPAFSSTYFTSLSAANLTALTAANLTGTIATGVQDLITRTGIVVSGTWSGGFGSTSGANLTSLVGTNFSTGTVPSARLGSGTPSIDTILRGDSVWTSLEGSAVPTGMVVFTSSTCPTGFSEYTAARGRAIMGLPASGTSQGTVGTAFTNLENRAFGHSVPSVTVGAVTSGTSTNGSHNHTGTTGGPSSGQNLDSFDPGSFTVTSTSGHTHSFTTDTQGSHSHTFTTSAGSTGTSTTGNAATSDIVSYIQLRSCRKD